MYYLATYSASPNTPVPPVRRIFDNAADLLAFIHSIKSGAVMVELVPAGPDTDSVN